MSINSWVNPFPPWFINRTTFFCNALESHGCACCLLFEVRQYYCHCSIFIGSFLYQRAKPPQGTVLFINLLGKGLTPMACIGDGGSIRLAHVDLHFQAEKGLHLQALHGCFCSPILITYAQKCRLMPLNESVRKRLAKLCYQAKIATVLSLCMIDTCTKSAKEVQNGAETGGGRLHYGSWRASKDFRWTTEKGWSSFLVKGHPPRGSLKDFESQVTRRHCNSCCFLFIYLF